MNPGSPARPDVGRPADGTVERWAWDYVLSTDLSLKLKPPAPPKAWETGPIVRRLDAPGRPPELRVVTRAEKRPGREALRAPEKRIQIFHTFLHHELQAAELMAWAVLAFPAMPRAFRGGLVHILRDEVRHMALYEAHLGTLGAKFGDRPVRDWFWERAPRAETPEAFVAFVGIGLEGGNLDHAERFAGMLRGAGDEAGAQIEEQIALEELPHVRFALRWFSRLTGGLDFATWSRALPPPISPALLRGLPLARSARLKAGFPEAFLDELEAARLG